MKLSTDHPCYSLILLKLQNQFDLRFSGILEQLEQLERRKMKPTPLTGPPQNEGRVSNPNERKVTGIVSGACPIPEMVDDFVRDIISSNPGQLPNCQPYIRNCRIILE